VYRTPEARLSSVREVRNALLASRRAVLTTHLNADGDGAGCEAALVSWLRANGTEAWIINPTVFPDAYRFLVEHSGWVVEAGSPLAQDLCDQADLAVVLDTGEVPRIGRVRNLIRELKTVVVDHHQPGDQPIGGISLRDPDACATGELLFDILLAAKGPWPVTSLQGMYAAILTDTGGFRFSNATPGAHRVVAELIAMGVDPEEMHERVYGAAPLKRYRLLRHALTRWSSTRRRGSPGWSSPPKRSGSWAPPRTTWKGWWTYPEGSKARVWGYSSVRPPPAR